MIKREDTKTMELGLTMGNQMEMIIEIEIIGMDIITDMEIMWNIMWDAIGMKGITIIWDIWNMMNETTGDVETRKIFTKGDITTRNGQYRGRGEC